MTAVDLDTLLAAHDAAEKQTANDAFLERRLYQHLQAEKGRRQAQMRVAVLLKEEGAEAKYGKTLREQQMAIEVEIKDQPFSAVGKAWQDWHNAKLTLDISIAKTLNAKNKYFDYKEAHKR